MTNRPLVVVALHHHRLSGGGRRLLGGSVGGGEGAERTDTVVTVLRAEMTGSELQNAALAYAPTFGPVRGLC